MRQTDSASPLCRPMAFSKNMETDTETKIEACRAYARMMNTLDVSHILRLLDEKIKYTSQWVFSEINGKKDFLEYIEAKLKSISGSSDLVWAELAHTNVLGAGPCLVMAQGQKDKLVATVLIEVRDAKISEIAMCLIPTPAQCRRTGEYPK